MKRRRRAGLALAALLLPAASIALAEGTTQLAPMPKECAAPGAPPPAVAPLPHVANALSKRKRIKILAIGGTSASLRGPVSGGQYAAVERYLEATFKGVDVDVVHRGVSGELADAAGRRIENEVALTEADLVLWQLGTADAMARVPIEEFKVSVSRTVDWLKSHNVDVIIVGLRYARALANDQHYQSMRKAVQAIAKDLSVLRMNRYEAEETLERIRKNQGVVLADAEITEAGYLCLAEDLARTIAAGLFLKDIKRSPPPPPAMSDPKN